MPEPVVDHLEVVDVEQDDGHGLPGRQMTPGLFEEEAARGHPGQFVMVGDLAPLPRVGVEQPMARQDPPGRRHLRRHLDLRASLGQKVVIPEGESGDFDGELVVRGQHQRVHVPDLRLGADLGDQLQAILSRHLEIGDEQIEAARPQSHERLHAVGRRGHDQPELPRDRCQPDAEVLVILDDEHTDRILDRIGREVTSSA